MRIEKLKRNFNIKTELVHFPLHPDTPIEGRSLLDLFGGGPEAIAEKQSRMAGLMAEEGLPYGERTHTYNSRLAQELGKWADTQPDGSEIHDALFRAYFVENRNLATISNLIKIAERVGSQSLAFDFVHDLDGQPWMVEVCFGYVAVLVHDCPGHWDRSLNWHAGHIWPQDAILEDLLATMEQREQTGPAAIA